MNRLLTWFQEKNGQTADAKAVKQSITLRLSAAQIETLNALAVRVGMTRTATAEHVMECVLSDVSEWLDAPLEVKA